MFFKKKEINRMNEFIKDHYLIGIDLKEEYLELFIYNPNTNNITSDFFDIKDENIINTLHQKRREDSIKMFNVAYNDIYINQIDEDNKAVMSFDKVDNKVQLRYDVSTNLVRRLEEIEFIRRFIDLYSLDRKVYSMNKNIIDLDEYRKNKTIVKSGFRVSLLDKQNYVKDIQFSGKLLSSEFIPQFEEMKELQKIERSM